MQQIHISHIDIKKKKNWGINAAINKLEWNWDEKPKYDIGTDYIKYMFDDIYVLYNLWYWQSEDYCFKINWYLIMD